MKTVATIKPKLTKPILISSVNGGRPTNGINKKIDTGKTLNSSKTDLTKTTSQPKLSTVSNTE